jgi:hypothetical protein
MEANEVKLRSLLLGGLILMTTVAAIIGMSRLVEAVSVPRFYVHPGMVTAAPGETFNITIRIADADDLYTYQFRLTWNGPILNVTGVAEGPFLNKYGIYETFFPHSEYNGLDPSGLEGDYVFVGCSRRGKVSGETGGGVLATITFLVEAEGTSVFDVYDTTHIDRRGVEIAHTTEDGYFDMAGLEFYVDPASVSDPTLVVNETFAVNVSISEVADLKGFEFKLAYDMDLLNVTEIEIISFLNEPTSVNKTIDNDAGFVYVNVTSTGAPVNGSGSLARATFVVVAETRGESILDLHGTKVDDSLARSRVPSFEHSPPATDGYFSNLAMNHDVAVTLITPYPTTVALGEQISINVTVRNQGDFDESFNITVSYDGNVIETQSNITVGVGAQQIVTFTWDTTGVAAGMYTIEAEVAPVPDETDTGDNTETYSPITIEAAPGWALDPLVIAAIVIVVVVVVAALVYFLRVRK